MRIIRGIENWKFRLRRPVAALGVFDGVHRGHRRIVSRAVARARKLGGKSVVITFDPHPLSVIRPESPPSLLTSHEHKLRLIRDLGADYCLVIKFSRAFSRRRPRQFIRDVLVKKLAVREVVVGGNFAFGRNQQGRVGLFSREAARYGFRLWVVKMLKTGGQPVSSTLIRRLIEKGELVQAARLLGRRVSVRGTVVPGSGRGKTLGFPTANIDPHHEAIPPPGVYAVRVLLNSRRFAGMVNIGFRPTFRSPRAEGKAGSRQVEVHIFDFRRNLYGKDMEVVFLKMIRPEKRFPNTESLVSRIRLDERIARRITRAGRPAELHR